MYGKIMNSPPTQDIMFTFKVNIPKVEYFQQKQQNPTIHVYFINGNEKTHVPCKYKLNWEHFHTSFQYCCKNNSFPSKLHDGFVIAFDFYVETQNSKGVWCRMHRGSSNVFLKDTFMKLSNEKNKTIKTKLTNTWSNIVLGNIELDLSNVFSNYTISFNNTKKMFFEDKLIMESIDKRINNLVHGEMGLFDGSYTMKPINGFLTRVHAPIFQGRVAPMPGFAYVMNSTKLPATVSWFHRYYNQSLERLNMTDADVKRIVKSQFKQDVQIMPGFHDCCLLLTTMVSLTAACYPYESDFYMANGSQKPFESFDNLFIRRAGDCEDFARGMHFVLSTFQTTKIQSKWGGLFFLQKVANLYLSGIVLASVATPQHGGVMGLFKSRQAHMYTQIFPVKYFIENTRIMQKEYKDSNLFETVQKKYPHKPWMSELRVYVIEGTAPVQPFTSLVSMQSEMDPIKQEFEIKSLRTVNHMSHIPDGIQREFRPRWSVSQDSFYKNCAHFYTDFFIRNGVNTGSFAFYDNSKGTYGVDLQQVLEQKNFSFLPHQIFETADLELIKELLSYEHPFPKLDYTSTSVLIGGPQENILNHFITKMRAANAGKEDVDGTTDLYNDFFIQSPHQRSLDNYDRIFTFFQERTVRQELYLEGFDQESAIFRVRAYGLK